jgi:hypothetical protein
MTAPCSNWSSEQTKTNRWCLAFPQIGVGIGLSQVEDDPDDGVALLHQLSLRPSRCCDKGTGHRIALDSGADKIQIPGVVGLSGGRNDIAFRRQTCRRRRRLWRGYRHHLRLINGGRVRTPSVGEVCCRAAIVGNGSNDAAARAFLRGRGLQICRIHGAQGQLKAVLLRGLNPRDPEKSIGRFEIKCGNEGASTCWKRRSSVMGARAVTVRDAALLVTEPAAVTE